MFDPRGLVVLVVLLDEGGEWVGSLWRSAVGGSLGLDGHLLAVHHQLKPRMGRFKNYEKRLKMSSTCHGSDRTPCELCPNSCCAALHQVIEKCILNKRLRYFPNAKHWFYSKQTGVVPTNGVSTVDALVAVLGADGVSMASVYHRQFREPGRPKNCKAVKEIKEKHKSLPFHGLLSPTAPKGSMPISANMTGDEGNWKIV